MVFFSFQTSTTHVSKEDDLLLSAPPTTLVTPSLSDAYDVAIEGLFEIEVKIVQAFQLYYHQIPSKSELFSTLHCNTSTVAKS